MSDQTKGDATMSERVRASSGASSSSTPKPRLKHAEVALERARAKNGSGRGWRRYVTALRRNQAAVNDALIDADRALVETAEWLREQSTSLASQAATRTAVSDLASLMQEQTERLSVLARDVGELASVVRQQGRLIEALQRKVELRAQLATEQEQRAELQRRQLVELERRLARSEQRHAGEAPVL